MQIGLKLCSARNPFAQVSDFIAQVKHIVDALISHSSHLRPAQNISTAGVHGIQGSPSCNSIE